MTCQASTSPSSLCRIVNGQTARVKQAKRVDFPGSKGSGNAGGQLVVGMKKCEATQRVKFMNFLVRVDRLPKHSIIWHRVWANQHAHVRYDVIEFRTTSLSPIS
jgi:hypothetical protein